MKKLTKEMITELGDKVVELCKKEGYEHTSVYYDGKRVHIGDIDFVINYDDETDMGHYENAKVTVEENCHPGDYFEYYNHNHILSMSFEGLLYDLLNEYGECKALDDLLKEYGLYYELGNSWNLSVYPIDDMKVEGYKYEKEPEDIYLYNWMTNAPQELQNIMDWWYKKSEETGDIGSCVIGAGFNFKWNGNKYFMSACSPWQGSISWEQHADDVKEMLKQIGATEIYYNWGRMD